MADDDIEIGEDIEIDVVRDENGDVIGTVVDDLVVVSAADGSVVDEIVDVFDADGALLVEDETVSVYDADAHLLAKNETIAIALDPADE